MPNHVANELVIRGDSPSIKDFIRFSRGTGLHWKGSDKPEIVNDLELSHFVHPDLGRRGKELLMPYSALATGEPMGYDWCMDEDHHGEGEISYQFNTAWETFNNRVSIAMSSAFPTLRFELTYFEPGMGFKGERVWNFNDGLVMKCVDDYRDDDDCPFQYECLVSAG